MSKSRLQIKAYYLNLIEVDYKTRVSVEVKKVLASISFDVTPDQLSDRLSLAILQNVRLTEGWEFVNTEDYESRLKEQVELVRNLRAQHAIELQAAKKSAPVFRIVATVGEGSEKQQPKEAKPVPKPTSSEGSSLPPPETYAAAVVRAINRQKQVAATADKVNRAKMKAVSDEAAKVREATKEEVLKVKYREGYLPLAERKRTVKGPKATESAEQKTLVQTAAGVVHSFVRFSRHQMKVHQAAVLKKTGSDRWFSAAERQAYKALSPRDKAKVRADVATSKQARMQAEAQDRQVWRKERQERLAKETQRRIASSRAYSAGDKLRPPTKGKNVVKIRQCGPGACRLVTDGSGSKCRDCGWTIKPE